MKLKTPDKTLVHLSIFLSGAEVHPEFYAGLTSLFADLHTEIMTRCFSFSVISNNKNEVDH